MKNYKDSDYAANKYSEGIVYRFADSVEVVSLDTYIHPDIEFLKKEMAKML